MLGSLYYVAFYCLETSSFFFGHVNVTFDMADWLLVSLHNIAKY